MIEGRDADDKYRMVEDEFVVVANQFTAHLHRAEYERLKVQTSSQNANAIASIARPVVGQLTEIARKRQETVLRRRQQTEALRKAKSNAGQDELGDDEADAPWRGTALHGLMETRTYDQVPLTRLVQPEAGYEAWRRSATASVGSSPASRLSRPSSSASALPMTGLKRLREEDIETESDDDEDDLDAGVVNRPRSLTAGPATKRPSLATPTIQPAAKHSISAPQQKHPASKLLPAALISRASAAPSSSRPPPRHRPASSPLKAPAPSSSQTIAISSDSEDDPFASVLKKRHRTKAPDTASTPTKAPAKSTVSKAPAVSAKQEESSGSDSDLFADFMKSRRKNSRPIRRPSQPEEKPERKKPLRELIALMQNRCI
ncbi:hypothetical protein F5X68DRAFT_279797 [Plectosphaerella plurivora]|uniref:Uncharacterized protein n=1 Tax=Plectosphaerella plurivora TaxID=936078 RepID=A0A9P8V0M8_9PEZI|nr:hypothetical protein F5X68DRAFT_279797 [Plectosphaerella plurivora]